MESHKEWGWGTEHVGLGEAGDRMTEIIVTVKLIQKEGKRYKKIGKFKCQEHYFLLNQEASVPSQSVFEN